MLAATGGWVGCKKKVARSPIPHITDQELLTDSTDSFQYHFVHFGHSEDTAIILFNFTDGDADLGADASGSGSAVYLKDSRDTTTRPFAFPTVPGELLTPDEGMEGRAAVFLQAVEINAPIDTNKLHTGDTVVYELFVKDRAGNESNHLILPPLRVKPF